MLSQVICCLQGVFACAQTFKLPGSRFNVPVRNLVLRSDATGPATTTRGHEGGGGEDKLSYLTETSRLPG